MKRINVFVLAGAVFSLVGAVLLSAGILMGMRMSAFLESPNAYVDGDPAFLACMMCGMGGLCVIIGLVLLLAWLRHERRDRQLVRRGIYVWGRVTDVRYDWSVRIGGTPGLDLAFREDGAGDTGREFTAGPFRMSGMLLRSCGGRAKIYLGDGGDGDYYIDMSTFVPGPGACREQ